MNAMTYIDKCLAIFARFGIGENDKVIKSHKYKYSGPYSPFDYASKTTSDGEHGLFILENFKTKEELLRFASVNIDHLLGWWEKEEMYEQLVESCGSSLQRKELKHKKSGDTIRNIFAGIFGLAFVTGILGSAGYIFYFLITGLFG